MYVLSMLSTKSWQNNEQTRRNISVLVLLSLIIMSGFYLRALDLGEPNFVHDEYRHVFAAKSILENGNPVLPSGKSYTRALLFTYTVALSFRFLGVSEYSARLPSVVFGTLSIMLIFFVGKRFFGAAVGLIAAFLFAFVPLEIVWSRECRFYSMYQFFYILSVFAFYNGFENNKTSFGSSKKDSPLKILEAIPRLYSRWGLNLKWLILSIAAFCVALTLQPLMILFYGSILLYCLLMLVFAFIRHGFREAIRTKYFVFIFLSLTASTVIALLFPDSWRVITTLTEPLPWAADSKRWFFRYLALLNSYNFFPIGAFFLLGVVRILVGFHKAGFYAVICVGVPLIVHGIFVSFGAERYILDISSFILLVCAFFIYDFFKINLADTFGTIATAGGIGFSPSKKMVKAALVSLFVFLFLPLSWWFRHSFQIPSYSMSTRAPEVTGWIHEASRAACRYVKEFSKPGDIVIASTPLAAYYYCDIVVDYELNNGNFYHIAGDGRYYDPWINVRAIKDLAFLEKVVSSNPRGWFLLEISTWENDNSIPMDIKDFINSNLTRHDAKGDLCAAPEGRSAPTRDARHVHFGPGEEDYDTMLVFSWGREYSCERRN